MLQKKYTILAIEHPFERYAFKALLALLFVMLGTYLYFVTASVLNIIERKEASAMSVQLETAIASMEKEYFALGESVNPATAPLLGLTPVAATSYVYRPGNTAQADTIATNGL